MPLRGEGELRVLPNIELTRTEKDQLEERRQTSYCGSEGYVIPNFRPGVCRKVFLDSFQIDKKFPKLAWLFQNEERLSNGVKILSTVSYQKELVPYDMTYDPDDIPLLDVPLNVKEKILPLQVSRDKLDYFHTLGIIYGDVKANNILINRKTGNLSFCDLDNVQIEDRYPIDSLSDYLLLFSDEDGFLDSKADIYMHNLMTLSELDGESLEYDQILEMLELGGAFDFLESSANVSLRRM